MTDARSTKALLPAPPMPPTPPAELIAQVARDTGVSPFRQLSDIARLSLGRTKLNMDAYYTNRVYRKELSGKQKRAFVGLASNYALNQQLNPLHDTETVGFIRNKVRYGEMLLANGLRTTALQAVSAQSGDHGEARVMRDVDEVVAFLRSEARYPLFGKPASGSRSVGSALITRYDAQTDEVVLGNGKAFDVTAFAQELLDDYAKGFLLQDAVEQAHEMTALAGPALGSVRILTADDGSGPQVLYTLWKVPSPTAMSDNFWQKGSMLAKVDEATGKVVSCKRGTGPNMEDVTHHPETGVAFDGFQIPHWEEAKALAIAGHALFPQFGVFGWDMGIGVNGPLIIEGNVNPYHPLYQLATGRGLRNPEFEPILQRIIKRQKANAPKA